MNNNSSNEKSFIPSMPVSDDVGTHNTESFGVPNIEPIPSQSVQPINNSIDGSFDKKIDTGVISVDSSSIVPNTKRDELVNNTNISNDSSNGESFIPIVDDDSAHNAGIDSTFSNDVQSANNNITFADSNSFVPNIKNDSFGMQNDSNVDSIKIQQTLGSESNTSSKFKLVLDRKKSFVGSLVAFDIYIDGEKVGKIKNGEKVELDVASGKHVISINKNNPVDIEINGDTSADVVVFGANNFGITNIGGLGSGIVNNTVDDRYIKNTQSKVNSCLITSIAFPIISTVMLFTINYYITPWVYGMIIGYSILNIVGLKNIKDNSSLYKSSLIKCIISIVICIIAAIIGLYIASMN